VWPSICPWMRSASNFPCLRREENPSGRTGYPKNYWNSFFVVLNAAKDWVRPGSKLKSKGIEFDVGDKYLLWQLTGLLIRQSCQAC
jgi:hypothetical protein